MAANLAGWSDSAYCSGPKTLEGKAYNYTLEHPDPLGLPCIGPRDHVRLWDMGYNPSLGVWSVGSAHHEHTVCDPICHHVIDSWERAEADARSSFLNGRATLEIVNYTLQNLGYYQGVFNDGNATLVVLKPPVGQYPVVFNENGLGNQTSWSVTVNGTTISSQRPDIVFTEPNGTYRFTVGTPSGFYATPASGSMTVGGAQMIQSILFRTPWTTTSTTVSASGRQVSVGFSGNATIATSTVNLSVGADTSLSFRATEIGPVGVINITVPTSILPSGASTLVYVDGVRDANARITSSANSYSTYVTVLYGTHTVELQFSQRATPYLEYIAGVVLAGSIVGILFFVFRLRTKRRPRSLASERLT